MSSKLKKGLVTLLLCTATSWANAEGWYLGATFGPSEVDVNGYDDANSYRIFFGAEASDNLAIETGFVDLGTFDVTGTSASVDAWGVDVSLLGKLPVSDSVSLFGKLGFFIWDVEGTIPGLLIATDTGTDITYGFGGEFDFSNQLSGRISWDFYSDVSGGDIDVVSFGVLYQF